MASENSGRGTLPESTHAKDSTHDSIPESIHAGTVSLNGFRTHIERAREIIKKQADIAVAAEDECTKEAAAVRAKENFLGDYLSYTSQVLTDHPKPGSTVSTLFPPGTTAPQTMTVRERREKISRANDVYKSLGGEYETFPSILQGIVDTCDGTQTPEEKNSLVNLADDDTHFTQTPGQSIQDYVYKSTDEAALKAFPYLFFRDRDGALPVEPYDLRLT